VKVRGRLPGGRAADERAADERAAMERGIVQPVTTANTPTLAPRVLLAATQNDFQWLADRIAPQVAAKRNLYASRLIQTTSEAGELTVAGPFMGSAYAVMLLETLLTWGAGEFLFLGWCGGIHRGIEVGDLLWATDAFIDEGTSPSYGQEWQGRVSAPAGRLAKRAAKVLAREAIAFRQGPLWTTDAVFRETPSKVKRFQQAGALAVEMEVSALYSAAAFHKMPCLALLTVSDLLTDGTWRPGFKAERFNTNRRRLCEAALKICLEKEP
jgi:purine-nucleoside phosphorylase